MTRSLQQRLKGIPYAAVAANTSTCLALVIKIKTNEKTCVKAAMMPKRTNILSTKYSATMDPKKSADEMVELKTFAVHKIYLSLYSKYWASSSTGFLIRCPTQLCHQRKTLLRNKEPRVPSALRALRAMRSDGRDVSHRVLSLPINGKSPMFLSLNRLRRNSRSQAFGECWAFISVCRSVQPHL